MQADWEVEIGGDAPVIDACWPGLVDLQRFPNRVAEVKEIQMLPALAGALLQLNAAASPVWTSKCDVWPVNGLDRFELDAPTESATHGAACYIDLLPVSDQQWSLPAKAVAFCKQLCGRLQDFPLICCRADLVVRRAVTPPEADDLGVTAYLSACGSTAPSACAQLEHLLAAFVDAVLSPAIPHSQIHG
jgi:hypothetical protein